jgi:hypothetical protein
MSALSPREMQTVTELADVLYAFLPGNPHPKADQRISFPGAAAVAGVRVFWTGGSKRPAIAQLLRTTLEQRRGAFCDLIAAIVKNALVYRKNKQEPLRRDEIDALNAAVELLGFKIPELRDPKFLQSLAEGSTVQKMSEPVKAPSSEALHALKQDFFQISNLGPQERGFAFERTLSELFHAFELAPRASFRLVGEQIDGSFDFNDTTYLVEAKWLGSKVGFADLMTFAGKIQGKARWSRGLFISYSGYSEDGLEAFQRGRPTDIVCVDGADLWHVLTGAINLRELISRKARRAVETNRAFIPARELFANVT